MREVGLEIRETRGITLQNIKTQNEIMRSCLRKAEKSATVGCVTLIRGENGVGREYISQAIHNLRYGGEGKFLKVHCFGLPDMLSIGDIINRISSQGGKGTIFLNEIAELSPKFQRKFIMEMESGELHPGRLQKMNISIISSTNENIPELIAARKFRPDLFFSLSEFSMFIPPLRDRSEDLPSFIDKFLEESSVKYRKLIRGFKSKKIIQKLIDYHWPGNLRELKNVIHQAVIMSEGEYIEEDDMPPPILDGVKWFGERSLTLKNVVKRHIRYVMGMAGCNIKEVASILDVPEEQIQEALKVENEERQSGLEDISRY